MKNLERKQLWQVYKPPFQMTGSGLVLAGLGGAILESGLRLAGHIQLPNLTFQNAIGLDAIMVGGAYVLGGGLAVTAGLAKAGYKTVQTLRR